MEIARLFAPGFTLPARSTPPVDAARFAARSRSNRADTVQFLSPASFTEIPARLLPTTQNLRTAWRTARDTMDAREETSVYKNDVVYGLFRNWVQNQAPTLGQQRLFPSAETIAARLNQGLRRTESDMRISPTVVKMALIKLAAIHPSLVGSRKKEGVFVMPTDANRQVIVGPSDFEHTFQRIRNYLLRQNNGFQFVVENNHQKRSRQNSGYENLPSLTRVLGLTPGALVRESVNGLIQEGVLTRQTSRKNSFTTLELTDKNRLQTLGSNRRGNPETLAEVAVTPAAQFIRRVKGEGVTRVFRQTLANALGVSETTVRQMVGTLQQRGLLGQVHGSKSGYPI